MICPASRDGQDRDRLDQHFELDPLFQCLVDLPCVGRHLGPGAAVDDRHIAGAQAQGGAGRVDGRVAAADNHHPVAQPDLFAQANAAQEGHAVEYALGVFAGNGQLLRFVGADGQEYGAVAVGE